MGLTIRNGVHGYQLYQRKFTKNLYEGDIGREGPMYSVREIPVVNPWVDVGVKKPLSRRDEVGRVLLVSSLRPTTEVLIRVRPLSPLPVPFNFGMFQEDFKSVKKN